MTSNMIGQNLITKQTDAKGRPCSMVQVVECLDIAHEYYFALLMDRAMNGPVIVCSPKGGMDIEAVAHDDPSAIHKIPVDVKIGGSAQVCVPLTQRPLFSRSLHTHTHAHAHTRTQG